MGRGGGQKKNQAEKSGQVQICEDLAKLGLSHPSPGVHPIHWEDGRDSHQNRWLWRHGKSQVRKAPAGSCRESGKGLVKEKGKKRKKASDDSDQIEKKITSPKWNDNKEGGQVDTMREEHTQEAKGREQVGRENASHKRSRS